MKITTFVFLLISLTGSANAQTYRLDWLCINSGGETEQSSANYGAKLTLAQPIAGYCESGNHHAYLGFWCPILKGPTPVEEAQSGNLPTDYSSEQNYPNPFNPATAIKYSLPRRSHVIIEVFNLLGQNVCTLVDREETAGTHSVIWDGTDSSGEAVSSGIYFYRFQAGDFVETKKMLLLK